LIYFHSIPNATTPQPDLGKGGPHTPLGDPSTPLSSLNDMPPKYTGPNTPNTPGSVTGDNFSAPSPQSSEMHRLARSGTPGKFITLNLISVDCYNV